MKKSKTIFNIIILLFLTTLILLVYDQSYHSLIPFAITAILLLVYSYNLITIAHENPKKQIDSNKNKEMPIIVKQDKRTKKLIAGLRDQFTDFFNAISSRSNDSSKLVYFIERIRILSQQQNDNSSKIDNSLLEISNILREVVGLTEKSKKQVNETYDSAEKGVEKMGQSMKVMTNFFQSMDGVNKTTRKLTDSTEKISAIIDIIVSISQKIELLSFNAAIEAAKVKEHGRGFNVVAQEIRKLSDMTKKSSDGIANLINSMQFMVLQLISQLKDSTGQLDKGWDAVYKTKEIFDEILKHTKKSKLQTESLFEAIDKQSNSLNSITECMYDLTKNTYGIHNSIKESEEFAEQISVSGEESLRRLLSYRLKNKSQKILFHLRRLSKKIIEVLEKGERDNIDIWDTNYIPMPNTNPIKYVTSYINWIDKSEIQKLQDGFQRELDVKFVVLVDKNGYLPKHNSSYDYEMVGDPKVDLLNSRSRRIFNDRTGLRAGQNSKDVLLQTYVRDTGEVMMDMSLPIYVSNVHWGGIRVGYQLENGSSAFLS